MRSFDYDFLVAGKPMLAPDDGVRIQFEDIDTPESGRDAHGVMARTVLREKLRTWSFIYHNLTTEEFRYMDGLFRGRNIFRFTFRWTDGKEENCMAYCNRGSITLHDHPRGLYKDLKFDIIES